MAIEEFFKHRVYIFADREHGHQDYADIKHAGYKIETIFDVGANIGQSAIKFISAFPLAKIFCFEPVSANYEKLISVLKGAESKCFQVALGSSPGKATIYVNNDLTTCSLLPSGPYISKEFVEITTIDVFSSKHAIEKIDLLKIDAEGFDLEVLKGAENMLTSKRISLVLVEVGFHVGDKRHVLFDEVRNYLCEKGFSVFGFYAQALEWSGKKCLRFANVLFSDEQPFASTQILK